MLNHQGFCTPSEISSTFWLLDCVFAFHTSYILRAKKKKATKQQLRKKYKYKCTMNVIP